jgi:Uma2 family endonuclease
MATATIQTERDSLLGSYDYPTRDGRPMGETDWHRNVMFDMIETLKAWYGDQQVYVTGNLLLFYEEGNRRKHISPDTMVVKGARQGVRLNYLVWQEGRTPNVVIEITSPSTRNEDLRKKYEIYRTILRVSEYFLFDPLDEYLKPRLQGFRLIGDEYVPIEPQSRRLPSKELSLHLEASGKQLRLFDPVAGVWLPTIQERAQQAELAQQQAELAQQQAELAQQQATEGERRALAENERLQRELDDLRNRLAEGGR